MRRMNSAFAARMPSAARQTDGFPNDCDSPQTISAPSVGRRQDSQAVRLGHHDDNVRLRLVSRIVIAATSSLQPKKWVLRVDGDAPRGLREGSP